MRDKIISLIITLFLFSSCDIPCIHPGDGINSTTENIDVHIKISNDMEESKPETLWIKSKLTISDKDEVPLIINGEINFCDAIKQYKDPDSEEQKKENLCPSINCKESILVPNIWCRGGTMPTLPLGTCLNGDFDEDGYYANTGLTVDSGNSVIFDLVPALKMKINNCDNLPQGIVNYSVNDLKDLNGDRIKDDNGKELDPKKICESGQTAIIKGKSIKFGPFMGDRYHSGIVSDDNTPYSNKVYVGGRPNNWLSGSTIDLRNVMPFVMYDDGFCSYTPDTSNPFNTKYVHPEYKYQSSCGNSSELLRYNTYDINYMCGAINFSGQYVDGVYSVRYEEDGRDCYRGIKLDQSYTERKWADLLIAKIGDDKQGLDNDFRDPGEQCVYSISNTDYDENNPTKVCMDVNNYPFYPSLELNKRYKVKERLEPGRSLMLGIAGIKNSYNKNKLSGYNVKVRKYCSYKNGEQLYLYAGNLAPTMKPGDPGTHHLEIISNAGSGSNITENLKFWINPKQDSSDSKSNSINGISGTLYFGIKGAASSDTVIKSKEGYKISADNKYSIIGIQPQWFPNFSKPFQIIYDALIKIFYGNIEMDSTDGVSEGVVRKLYINISRGLIPAIQASIVLYITIYGIMFMMGMIQNTRSDVMIRIIKIAFVAVLCTDMSWHFFGDVLFNLFVRSTNELIYFFSGNLSGDFDTSKTFTFLDKTVGLILTKEFWLRMLALFFAGPVGWLFLAAILWGVGVFFAAVIEAMITYLMIVIAVGLLLLLAPIFIAFILFQRTKQVFEGWLKMIISFALRPIFIFASLAFLNEILMAVFYGINQFGACMGCILSIDILGEEVCFLKLFLPMGFSNEYDMDDRINQTLNGIGFMGLPLSITMIIVFIIVANVMKSFLSITDSMVDMITGSFMSFRSGGPGDAAHSASQALLSTVGLDDQTGSIIKQGQRSANKNRQKLTFNPNKPGKDDKSEASRLAMDKQSEGSKAETHTANQEDLRREGLQSNKLSIQTDARSYGSQSTLPIGDDRSSLSSVDAQPTSSTPQSRPRNDSTGGEGGN